MNNNLSFFNATIQSTKKNAKEKSCFKKVGVIIISIFQIIQTFVFIALQFSCFGNLKFSSETCFFCIFRFTRLNIYLHMNEHELKTTRFILVKRDKDTFVVVLFL